MKSLAILLLFSNLCWARNLSKEYKTVQLQLGGKTISAFVADTDSKREKGLMFVTSLKENEGMIFIFQDQRPLSFWMKNTMIPLSIGFFDQKGRLVDIQEMQVAGSLMEQMPPSYQSKSPARMALEMNKGWFAKNKIALGTQLKLKAKSPSSLLNSVLSP